VCGSACAFHADRHDSAAIGHETLFSLLREVRAWPQEPARRSPDRLHAPLAGSGVVVRISLGPIEIRQRRSARVSLHRNADRLSRTFYPKSPPNLQSRPLPSTAVPVPRPGRPAEAPAHRAARRIPHPRPHQSRLSGGWIDAPSSKTCAALPPFPSTAIPKKEDGHSQVACLRA
jgi:hypothetical protein